MKPVIGIVALAVMFLVILSIVVHQEGAVGQIRALAQFMPMDSLKDNSMPSGASQPTTRGPLAPDIVSAT